LEIVPAFFDSERRVCESDLSGMCSGGGEREGSDILG
jgi:hypothetical protein